MIISVSRRTDIPAFYSAWLIKRLQEGFVYTRNPMNFRQVSSVKLSPEVVDCIVFWTKNPRPMLSKLDTVDAMGYSYYFQFTVTPYGDKVESGLPKKAEILETFRFLSDKIGKERMVWRYDPIIVTKTFSPEYHLECFEKMCTVLTGYTNQCTISFLDIYKKIEKRMQNMSTGKINIIVKQQIIEGFSVIAKKYKLKLAACCEEYKGIIRASCIDQERIEKILGYKLQGKRDENQRLGCGCIKSVDIGMYDSCGHGCLYCYANNSIQTVKKNMLHHDPKSPLMLGWLEAEDSLTVKEAKTLKVMQSVLF